IRASHYDAHIMPEFRPRLTHRWLGLASGGQAVPRPSRDFVESTNPDPLSGRAASFPKGGLVRRR
ncbi:MAG: hypothetical protein ACRD3E_17765, partial [Terriglobales bacterium]